MRIGVISDTHGVVPAWEQAMNIFSGADMILHAGDVLYHPPKLGIIEGYDIPRLIGLLNSCPVPLVIAKGNCDAEFYDEVLNLPALSPYALVYAGNLRIVVRHGHGMQSADMRGFAEEHQANVLITGHTHIPVLERLGNAVHVNPGSVSYPLSEKSIPTVGLIENDWLRIIELHTGNEVTAMAI